MALYLVQHGKNQPKDIDPDQGLSNEGKAEVQRIGDTARNYNVQVSKIRHSGKLRARQTAEILAEKLSVADVEAADGLKALDDVAEYAGTVDSGQNMMLVGHLPFMEKMASFLTTGSTEFTVFKFQNGGIVCLDKLENADRWAVMWALMPNVG